jgi:hypothetical protein
MNSSEVVDAVYFYDFEIEDHVERFGEGSYF